MLYKMWYKYQLIISEFAIDGSSDAIWAAIKNHIIILNRMNMLLDFLFARSNNPIP